MDVTHPAPLLGSHPLRSVTLSSADLLVPPHRNLQKLSLFGDINILQQNGSITSTYLSKVDPSGKKMQQ